MEDTKTLLWTKKVRDPCSKRYLVLVERNRELTDLHMSHSSETGQPDCDFCTGMKGPGFVSPRETSKPIRVFPLSAGHLSESAGGYRTHLHRLLLPVAREVWHKTNLVQIFSESRSHQLQTNPPLRQIIIAIQCKVTSRFSKDTIQVPATSTRGIHYDSSRLNQRCLSCLCRGNVKKSTSKTALKASRR